MRLQMSTNNFDKKRWLLLIGALLICVTCSWKQLWSITFNPLQDIYGISVDFLNSTYSIYSLLATLLMLLAGKLVDRFGASIMIFTGAISYFIGMALPGISSSPYAFAIGYIIFLSWSDQVVYVGAFDHLAKAFPDRRGITMSAASVGISLGGMVLPVLCQGLIDKIGFSAQFWIMAMILCGVCLIGLILCPKPPEGYVPAGYKIPDPAEEEQKELEEENARPGFVQKDWKMMLKDPAFYIYFIIAILGAMTGVMLMSQSSWMAQEIAQVTPAQGALLVSGLGLAAFVGKLFFGWLGDKIGRLNLMIIVFIIMTIVMVLLLFCEGKALYFVIVFWIGVFASGGISSSMPAITSDLFGTKFFALNFAIIMCSLPIGQAIVPWVATLGLKTGSFVVTFGIEAVAGAVGIVLCLILKKIRNGRLDVDVYK